MEVERVVIEGRVFTLAYAHLVRHMNGAEFGRLRKSIVRADRVTNPVTVDSRDNVLDGANRLRLCSEIGIPLSRIPIRVLDLPTAEEVAEFVRQQNVDRRHLTPEEIEEAAAERRPVVVASAINGKSTRQIAAETGVSQTTVVRDLASTVSGEPGGSPDTVEKTSSSLAEQAAALSKDGLSLKLIAERMGLSRSKVQRLLGRRPDAKPAKTKGKDGRTRKAPKPPSTRTAAAKRKNAEEKERAREFLRQQRDAKRAALPPRKAYPCNLAPADPAPLVRWCRSRRREGKLTAANVAAYRDALDALLAEWAADAATA